MAESTTPTSAHNALEKLNATLLAKIIDYVPREQHHSLRLVEKEFDSAASFCISRWTKFAIINSNLVPTKLEPILRQMDKREHGFQIYPAEYFPMYFPKRNIVPSSTPLKEEIPQISFQVRSRNFFQNHEMISFNDMLNMTNFANNTSLLLNRHIHANHVNSIPSSYQLIRISDDVNTSIPKTRATVCISLTHSEAVMSRTERRIHLEYPWNAKSFFESFSHIDNSYFKIMSVEEGEKLIEKQQKFVDDKDEYGRQHLNIMDMKCGEVQYKIFASGKRYAAIKIFLHNIEIAFD